MNSDQVKGKAKEAIGVVTDNEELKDEGKGDQMVGNAKEAVQNLADKVGEGIDAIKDKVNKD